MHYLTQIAAVIALMLLNHPANCQEHTIYNNILLPDLSEQLKQKNNEFFVVVDAYMDGLLKDDEAYDIHYNTGVLTINNKALKPETAAKYRETLLNFWNANNVASAWQQLHLEGKWDNVTLQYRMRRSNIMPCTAPPVTAEVAKSGVITTGSSKDIAKMLGPKYLDYYNNNSTLVKALCEDGILQKAGDVHIRYNDTEVFINGNQLDDRAAKKYRALVEQIEGVHPVSSKEFFGYTIARKEVQYYAAGMKK